MMYSCGFSVRSANQIAHQIANRYFMNATVRVICYKSKTLSNGEHPLMLKVSKNGKRKSQSLGISVHANHWDFQKDVPKLSCPNREHILKLILDKKMELQKRIIEQTAFQQEYTASSLLEMEEKTKPKAVGEFYTELIENYILQNKRGNASIYNDSLNSIKNFREEKLNFYFHEINQTWLKEYEEWLRARKCKETTISILFRTLRSAYNKAVENNYVRNVENPFKKFKVSKFNTKTQKRAITKEEILSIMKLDLTKHRHYMQFSRDLFIFSYLCGGINFSDMAYLKQSQIENGILVYHRKKTHKRISIPLQEMAISIIRLYIGSNSDLNEYVFPILRSTEHITEIQKENRIHKTIAKVNLCLKEIAKMTGIKLNLTTYVARHSYATILKNSGVNIALISETLGHSDLSTTQIYLDSFENSQIDEAMKNLL